MLVSTVLCILLWKRYSARLLGALRQHQAMRQAPLQGLLRKLVRRPAARLRRMEGGYRLQLDDQGFTLIHDRGARAARMGADRAPAGHARLLQGGQRPARGRGQGLPYPRHSDAMDPAAYRQGLALWLSKCPMEPETPAAMER
jgi:hypothetical protein